MGAMVILIFLVVVGLVFAIKGMSSSVSRSSGLTSGSTNLANTQETGALKSTLPGPSQTQVTNSQLRSNSVGNSSGSGSMGSNTGRGSAGNFSGPVGDRGGSAGNFGGPAGNYSGSAGNYGGLVGSHPRGNSAGSYGQQGSLGNRGDSAGNYGGSTGSRGDSAGSYPRGNSVGSSAGVGLSRQSSVSSFVIPVYRPGSRDFWVCSYCESINENVNTACKVCGFTR